MMRSSLSRWGLGALALAGLAAAVIDPALAQAPAAAAPAAPKPNAGDTAFVLISAYLVLLMTIRASPCSMAASCAPRTCCRC